jgi:predicted transcriptional regulator
MAKKPGQIRCPICGVSFSAPPRTTCPRCEIDAKDAVFLAEEGLFNVIRFSARSIRTQRRRLGLSARDFGTLVMVSASTVYSWEQDRTHPRHCTTLFRLDDIRKMKKKEAMKQLERFKSEDV